MLGDIFSFEKSAMGDRADLIKKDWWRVPLGILDEGGTKIWSTVLNKDMEPVVDYYGGTTKQNVRNAQAKGINTGPGEGMHDIARMITSIFAGNYGASKLGAFGGGGSSPMPMDMSGDALGQASQGAPGAFGSGPAKAPGGGVDWMQWARLGSNAMQNAQTPETPQAVPVGVATYRPPQVPEPGVLQPNDNELRKALLAKLLEDDRSQSPEEAIAKLFGNVDPMSPQADLIRQRAMDNYLRGR
jgi:hypothetical protein